MFNRSHNINLTDSTTNLTFVKSNRVNAYPCSRRRSTDIPAATDGDIYRIPFDPEARLNTEANNRRHSSLNGFTQTYLKSWNENNSGLIELSLDGYLFTLEPENSHLTENDFGDGISKALGSPSDATKLYANIILEEVKLYSGSPKEYYTTILQTQKTQEELDANSLDLFAPDRSTYGTTLDLNNALKDVDNYYFSGLSFSASPITGEAGLVRSSKPITLKRNDLTIKQQLISLCILEKVNGQWQIHEPARLPLIEHDATQNSIVVGDTRIKRVVDNGAVVDNYNGDLVVEHNATVTNNLYVGDSTNNVNSITVKANPEGDEPTLAVKGGATIDGIMVNAAKINDDLTVGTVSSISYGADGKIIPSPNGSNGACITSDGDAFISNDLVVGNKITTQALTIDTDIAAGSTTAEIITATEAFYQKVGDIAMQVPIIELEAPGQSGGFYQLKISRVGKKQ